jgi:hypothetical protein
MGKERISETAYRKMNYSLKLEKVFLRKKKLQANGIKSQW